MKLLLLSKVVRVEREGERMKSMMTQH